MRRLLRLWERKKISLCVIDTLPREEEYLLIFSFSLLSAVAPTDFTALEIILEIKEYLIIPFESRSGTVG